MSLNLFDIHTHHKGREFSIYCKTDVHDDYDGYHCFGQHPWYLKKVIITDYVHDQCIAIGEVGLDKSKDVDYELQIEQFSQEIIRAEKAKLPLIIHCVKAYYDCLNLLKNFKFKGIVIFHDYNGNKDITKRFLLEKNFYFSIGNTFMRKFERSSWNILLPMDRIFFETDDNDYKIKEIYENYATYMDESIDELTSRVQRNVRSIFPMLFKSESYDN